MRPQQPPLYHFYPIPSTNPLRHSDRLMPLIHAEYKRY
jgi:hypothetical protein